MGTITVAAMCAIAGVPVYAGAQQATAPGTQKSPQADARFDPAGYWVSIVTEDWRWRMVTPARGDYSSVPLNPEGRRTADLWDPARDEASGNQCRAYGVGGVMRIPGRLHITWENETVLRIETDAGTQTRLLRFGGSRPTGPDQGWQGYSVAEWEGPAQTKDGPQGGRLKVTTTSMRSGYLRKNGVPYSRNTTITEYFHRTPKEQNGDEWLIVTTIVEDPQYLTQPFITSTHFKKEADGSRWHPTPCSAR